MRYIKRISNKQDRVRVVGAASLLLMAAWDCVSARAGKATTNKSHPLKLATLPSRKIVPETKRERPELCGCLLALTCFSVVPLWKTKHTSHNKRTTIWAISRLWYIHAPQREMKIGRLLFSRSTMIFFGWTQGDHGQPCMYTVVSHTIDVKTPRSLVLKYKFELTRVGSQEEEQHIINKLLPLLTERIIAPSQPSNPYVVFGRRLARQERAKTRWQGFDVSIREYSRTWIWR
jgi:hypothetical protein